MKLTIYHGSEIMIADESGNISRPAIKMPASGQWRIIGARERNNFGHCVRFYSLQTLLKSANEIPWKFKNGKQRTFVCDSDHGTLREWRSPGHSVTVRA